MSEFEGRNTSGSTVLTTAALGLALFFANYGLIPTPNETIKLSKTEGTLAELFSLQITERDVFTQLNRVYEDLLRNQMELDPEAKRVLYANLWDLYT